MPIEIDIAHVARLARVELDEDSLRRYAEQLGVILEHAARVQALATGGVEPTAHPLPMINSFRPDDVSDPLDHDEVLAAAPQRENRFFQVPPALGTP
jgi:aspartyl-tRNA(Asn)/glutamyl-tRNA(Gln) amidotransferase subunit C